MQEDDEFTPVIEYDEKQGMHVGRVALPGTDEEVEYTHPQRARVARELEYAASIAEHTDGDVNTDPKSRAENAAEALSDRPGVVDVSAVPEIHEIRVVLTHTDIDAAIGTIPDYAGFKLINQNMTVRRPHGLVFELIYQLRPFAPPLPNDTDWSDAAATHETTNILPSDRLDRLAKLHEECQRDAWLATDSEICDGLPRIAGTEIVVYHIYYLLNELDKDKDDVKSLYPDVDDEDIDKALDYCQQNSEDAEQYAAEERERVKDIDLPFN